MRLSPILRVDNVRQSLRVFGRGNGLSKALDLFLVLIVLSRGPLNLPFLRSFCARVGAPSRRRVARSGKVSGKAVAIAMAVVTLLMFVYLYVFTPTGKMFVESSRKFFFYSAGYFGGISRLRVRRRVVPVTVRSPQRQFRLRAWEPS